VRCEFGVLGETIARLDGRRIELGPARQRAVLIGERNEALTVWREAHRICLAKGHPALADVERLLASAEPSEPYDEPASTSRSLRANASG
jgi:hypothetical protein